MLDLLKISRTISKKYRFSDFYYGEICLSVTNPELRTIQKNKNTTIVYDNDMAYYTTILLRKGNNIFFDLLHNVECSSSKERAFMINDMTGLCTFVKNNGEFIKQKDAISKGLEDSHLGGYQKLMNKQAY